MAGGWLVRAAHAPARPQRSTFWRRIVPALILSITLLVAGAGVGWWSRSPVLAFGPPTPTPTVTPSPSPTPVTPICTVQDKQRILLTGSSTIDAWGSYAEDLAPLDVQNIGVAGTVLADQLTYLHRIIPSIHPDVIVLFSGSNDVPAGRTPAQVVSDVNTFVQQARDRLPTVVVYFVSINEAPARSSVRTAYDRINESVAAAATADGPLRYIDTATGLRNGSGGIDASKYIQDGIHLNADGYTYFSKVIRDRLIADGYAHLPCT